MMGQHETQRIDDVRRRRPKHLAFAQGLADQPELVMLQIAQAAMDELGRPGGRPRGEIVHLGQRNPIAAARRVARDAGAIDAATHDEDVDVRWRHACSSQLLPE